MARRKKKQQQEGAAWLVTFSDLMTLLLTFFVLLLSMSSMDVPVITRISAYMRSLSPLDESGAGRIPERIQIAIKMLKDPYNILNKKNRVKDLLFPLDLLPKELSSSDLENNIAILEHPEGVVIVLTEGLLFARGSAELDATGKNLIAVLTPVMHSVNADINISGHTDITPTTGVDSYDLSFMRALAVMEQLLQVKMPPDRFSVSGYGPDKPMYSNDTEEGQTKNRRVEILVKTTPRMGGYL
ncbi:MAG: flagellar motor protein MotB [Desulfovibrio sp.]|jgi:chemotaxis protein MotB|nr:flagellar motor protein MotB [Desulfovibrio sp.]